MAELDLTLDRARLESVRHGATVVTTESAVFRITGPGALTCLQGLLTNDLEKPGEHSLVYGALLTPKGMIVVDTWVLRQPQALTLIVSPQGRAAALELFQRTLPPRLAQVTDLTGQETVARLHVRGHTNRELKGLRWTSVEPLDGRSVTTDQKEVGTVRSTLALEDRMLGLAIVRREIAPGDVVLAGGRRAKVVGLPFGAEDLDG